ncbi:hypothetical protein [Streptomyces halobius]|uniref:Uncharacterized protein n=1 Tax=Streptomyces halobius TaxID=2879846 RepID=A0ABY4M364_9ACTN|nr:hypothetical protein [Streptomyces halobius]UQA91653.1 hypothetical protein K9S39_07060 [Streptomyces halobius]
MTEKIPEPQLGEIVLGGILAALEVVEEWRDSQPHVVDYRIEDGLYGLQLARKALSHYQMGTQYPEWEAARKRFVATLRNEGGE